MGTLIATHHLVSLLEDMFVKTSVKSYVAWMAAGCMMFSSAAYAEVVAQEGNQVVDPTSDPTTYGMDQTMDDQGDFSSLPDGSRAIVPQYIDPAAKTAQPMYQQPNYQQPNYQSYNLLPGMNAQPIAPAYPVAPVMQGMQNMAPSYQYQYSQYAAPQYTAPNAVNAYPNYMTPMQNGAYATMPNMENMYAPYGVQPTQPQYGSADASYNQAMQSYRLKDYWTAMTKFQEVASMYPQSDLADNAYYWMGEIFYAWRNYPEAVRAFQTVMYMYPNGNKTPDAMLKMGYAYAEMQQYDAARAVLNDVSARFSNNATIRNLAVKKLQQLPMMY